MPIFKAKLSITVLLEEPDEPTARALLSNVSLMGLVYEIDDGEIAGSLSVASVEPVQPECVEAELLAVNAVPNFFTYPERAMAAEITAIAAILIGYLWLVSGIFVLGYITTWRHDTCPNWAASAVFVAERIMLGPIFIPALEDCSMSHWGHIISIASVATFGVAVTIVGRLISRRP